MGIGAVQTLSRDVLLGFLAKSPSKHMAVHLPKQKKGPVTTNLPIAVWRGKSLPRDRRSGKGLKFSLITL